ncbi:GyrI-like domain-containing protein [Microbacterium caowuchunii]|uniref:GyrI-like small molecule binding domain-containing protein n=1 Tax=Microbacterium caowuchunii TaxID=2614638 RepID=A0A5N0TN16_9MICO|nr:GyrI-like domain-containing protein [Microbacterium caowuchunii]KAA9135861.1 hypothetical protein F6B40_01370 [Microbacterium caowuchunii]
MKTDLKKELDSYRAAAGVFRFLDIPPLHYLMIDGSGDPNTSPAYRDAVATLFATAYRLKFLSKRELERDYVVMPLEALWSSADMASFTSARDKTRWDWTALMLVPEWIMPEHVTRVRDDLDDGAAPARGILRLQTLDEGTCVQTLHVGSYDDEGPVLRRMHEEVIPGRGMTMTGRHHEIYLNDPRRTEPAKLKTILRQPVTGASAGGAD